MRQFLAPVVVIALCAGPLAAETPAVPETGTDDGASLMEEGAKLFMRGILSQMEPALDEMGKALDEVEPSLRALQPKLRELMALVGDLQNYRAPEKLPNGDIILRRKTDQDLLLEKLNPGGIEL
ncbi:MAG: hypothetical protein V4516_13700 [Pseudomonadota bacterium]